MLTVNIFSQPVSSQRPLCFRSIGTVAPIAMDMNTMSITAPLADRRSGTRVSRLIGKCGVCKASNCRPTSAGSTSPGRNRLAMASQIRAEEIDNASMVLMIVASRHGTTVLTRRSDKPAEQRKDGEGKRWAERRDNEG